MKTQRRLNNIFTKRTKNFGALSERSLASLYELYQILKKHKTSKEFNDDFENKVQALIKNYAAEQDYVCCLFYKYGIVHGYENREKLKQEL